MTSIRYLVMYSRAAGMPRLSSPPPSPPGEMTHSGCSLAKIRARVHALRLEPHQKLHAGLVGGVADRPQPVGKAVLGLDALDGKAVVAHPGGKPSLVQ